MPINSSFFDRINLKRPAHIGGILAIGAGVLWFYTFRPRSLSQIFILNSFLLSNLIFLFFIAIMMIPGVIALYNGIGLLRDVTKKIIKGSVGSICVIIVFHYILPGIEKLFSLRGIVWPALLLLTIAFIPVYIFISRKIILSEKMVIIDRGEFIGKGILTLVAWEIWLTLSELVRAFVPLKEGHTRINEEPWNILGTFGSILITCVFYKIASKMLIKKESEQDSGDNIA